MEYSVGSKDYQPITFHRGRPDLISAYKEEKADTAISTKYREEKKMTIQENGKITCQVLFRPSRIQQDHQEK